FDITRLMDKAHDFKSGQLRGIAAVSADDVWVAGAARQIFHTTDGGKSWTQITGVPDLIDHFGDIGVDGQRVVAGAILQGNGLGIYESTDGGTSFNLLDFSASCPTPGLCEVYGVAMRPGGGAVAYGYAGTWITSGL